MTLPLPISGWGVFPLKTGGTARRGRRKFLRYERGIFSREDWLKRVSFIATDDAEYWPVAEGTHNYVINQHTKGKGYNG